MIDWDRKDIYFVQHSPEPSLRNALLYYYMKAGIGMETKEAEKLVDRYIEQFEKKAKE